MNFPSRIVFVSIILFSSFTLLSQTINEVVIDQRINKEVMIGYCDRSGLEEGEFGTSFKEEYELYQPKEDIIEKLSTEINQVQITIVYGTWCSDSRMQVGRFYKILDEAGFNDKNLTVIGVNRDKDAVSVNIENLEIERVPTFIVYQNNEELGRIIETPKKTLEKDLWKIVKKVQ